MRSREEAVVAKWWLIYYVDLFWNPISDGDNVQGDHVDGCGEAPLLSLVVWPLCLGVQPVNNERLQVEDEKWR